MRIRRPHPLALLVSVILSLGILASVSTAASPPMFLWESVVDSYAEEGGGGYDFLGELVPTPDGGLVAGGYAIPPSGGYDSRRMQPFLVRYDALGAELWRSYLNRPEDAGYEVRRIRRASDGGFVVACLAWTPPPHAGGGLYYHTSFLARIGADGAELWRHPIDPLELDAIGDFDLAPDGSILAAGRVWTQGGGTQVSLLKLSPAGARIWLKRVYPGDIEGVERVASTPDGGLYLVCGNGNLRTVYRYSPDGTMLWFTPISNLDADLYTYEKRTFGVTVTPDGGCVVAGGVRASVSASAYGQYRPFLASFDASGRRTATVLAWTESRWIHSVERMSDGGMLAAEGVDGSDSGTVFVRYDPLGNELWRAEYGQVPRTRYIDAIRETADGGFVASGGIESVGRFTSMDSYLLKVEGDAAAGPIEVGIDVRPSSGGNSVNPDANGLLPVALLSSDGFDATAVDLSSIRLEGAPVVRDGRGRYRAVVKDFAGDRRPDLLLFFSIPSLGLAAGTTTVEMQGDAPGGGRFTASDTVRIVGKGAAGRGTRHPVRGANR